MNKEILVVCDHGISSNAVAKTLQAIFTEKGFEFDVKSRGVFARKPSATDLENASVILTPFLPEELPKMKKAGLKPEYADAWDSFFKSVGEKAVQTYFDNEKNAFVNPEVLVKRITKA
ncbi:hypothetical protein KJ765_02595 [Candidatus Micrarchaeota archaeon]|nr:hypothetical protein [Candidatus Micrarchaeota archaeon]